MTQTVAPGRRELELLAWTFSPRVWIGSIVGTVLVLLLIPAIGYVVYDAPLDWMVIRALTEPDAVLLSFLYARGGSLLLAQRRRDERFSLGEIRVASTVSLAALITVASFSFVGLIALAVVLPFSYTTSGDQQLVAALISALVVPLAYLLLLHQVSERVAVDRYLRDGHVTPAVWHFLWSLPVIVLIWTVFVESTVLALPVVGEFVLSEALVGFSAVCVPTLVGFFYPVRWRLERVVRFIL